jgi:hypothetical protein
MAADKFLLESGAPDGYLLEDGSGILLMAEDNPPVFVPLPRQILQAWQPQVSVRILNPPGGGSPAPDDPPRNQAYGELENVRRAWQPTWKAQTGQRSAAWDITDNPPPLSQRAKPWIAPNWPAQSVVGLGTAWNVAADDPPPKSIRLAPWASPTWKAQAPTDGLAWDGAVTPDVPAKAVSAPRWPSQQWSAQRVTLGTAWDVALVADQPPPFTRQPPTILAAWQPNYRVTLLGTPGGGSVAVDNPPSYALPRVDARWKVTWAAQSAPDSAAWNTPVQQVDNPPPCQDFQRQKIAAAWQSNWRAQSYADNAGWNFVVTTPDNPPPLKTYPRQILDAWQPNVRVTLLLPAGGASVATADAPPPQQDFARQRISAMWAQTWRAQTFADSAHWNFSPPVIDNPPPAKPYPEQVRRAWQPEVRVTLLKPAGGESVATPGPTDDPPFGYRRPDTSASWYATWKSLDVRTAAGETQPADDPPPRQDYGVSRTILRWAQTWRAQTFADSAHWNFPAAVVDNPPVRQDYAKQQIVMLWQMHWPAQGPGQTAAWNFVPPVIDNPPQRQDFARQQIVASWQSNWLAQGPGQTAAWDFIPDPPPVQTFGRQQINAAWQSNWRAQSPGKTAHWNFPPPVIDNPPVRQDYAASRIRAAWQMSWMAQGCPWTVIPPDPLVFTELRRYIVVGERRVYIAKGDNRTLPS